MPTTGTMRYLTIGDSTYEVYNTDTEVIQTYVAASGYTNWRPLVVGYSSNSSETTAPTTTTGTTYTFNTIKVKPSNGTIRFGAAALYNGDYTTTISADTLTASRTLTAPNKSGTIALISDIPDVSGYAPLASPTFTGVPTAPTPGQSAGDTEIATVKYVQDAVSGAGTGTVTSVGVANATNGGLIVSGSPITGSGTISVGHSNVLTSAQTTSGIYPIKIDKNGHISEYGSAVSIPTKTSDLTNDSGFISSYTETDPTVPSWAKASNKPSYALSELTDASDVQAIEGLTGTSGFLKKTAADTWTLDTSTYLTSASTLDATKLSGTIPSGCYTDTKNTAGSTNSTSTLYLIGATSRSANSQTYSNYNLYFNKGLYSAGYGAGGNVQTSISQGDQIIMDSTDIGLNLSSCVKITHNGIYLQGTTSLYATTSSSYRTDLISSADSSNKTITLPNKTGTVALTSDIPTIPTVNNATLTIQKNGTNVATFTANASSNATANISVQTIYASTSDPTSGDGVDGDVWFVYEAPAE